MIHMRPSVESDVPRQRELWALAFGDGVGGDGEEIIQGLQQALGLQVLVAVLGHTEQQRLNIGL